MYAQTALRRAVGVQISTIQNAALFQDDILNHAAMALRHQEGVGRGTIWVAPHQAIVKTIHNLGAGIGRTDVQRGDLLRDVEDATAIAAAPFSCQLRVEAVAAPRHTLVLPLTR